MKTIDASTSGFSRLIAALTFTAVTFAQSGCATGQTKKIAIGMAAGAVVGAIVGHEFVHHGEYKQYESRNTVITSAIFALATGGALAWHYQEMEQQMVEISGRYARYRLCNPDEMNPDLARKLGIGGEENNAYPLQPGQIGKLAIALDDNTKWAYPIFRKRFLPPERGENQVISQRYIWEILKPGSFVTRSQNPQFFLENGGGK
jgi:hypothetical protein